MAAINKANPVIVIFKAAGVTLRADKEGFMAAISKGDPEHVHNIFKAAGEALRADKAVVLEAVGVKAEAFGGASTAGEECFHLPPEPPPPSRPGGTTTPRPRPRARKSCLGFEVGRFGMIFFSLRHCTRNVVLLRVSKLFDFAGNNSRGES